MDNKSLMRLLVNIYRKTSHNMHYIYLLSSLHCIVHIKTSISLNGLTRLIFTKNLFQFPSDNSGSFRNFLFASIAYSFPFLFEQLPHIS